MGKWGRGEQKATDANQTENGRFLLVRLYYMNRPSDCWITILAAAAAGWVALESLLSLGGFGNRLARVRYRRRPVGSRSTKEKLMKIIANSQVRVPII